MILGLGLGLAKNRRSNNLHPIAVARINAIYAAGGSCPVGASTAKQLLSDFIKAEESAGRWAAHKEIHLPGFGNAAANAFDFVTGASGTFVNTDANSFANGYFVGNNSNQRFLYALSPAGAGLIAGSASAWQILLEKPPSSKPTGLMVRPGFRSIGFGIGSSTSVYFAVGQTGGSYNVLDSIQNGIYYAAETATNSRYLRVRRSAGVTSLFTDTIDITGTTYDTQPMVAMVGYNGAFYLHADSKLGGYGISLGLSTADSDAFTANLKTLWEGLFQLSLP